MVKLPKKKLTFKWDLAREFSESTVTLGKGGVGTVKKIPGRTELKQAFVAVKEVKSDSVVLAELDTSVEFGGVIGPEFYGCQLDPENKLLYIAQEILFTPLDSKEFREIYLRMNNKEKLELIGKIIKQIKDFWDLGYLHKDIHRGNVMLDASGNPRLIDFGTASPKNSKREKKGTRSFMAPNQRKEIGNNQDIDDLYSAFILFGMLERRATIDDYINKGSPKTHRLSKLFNKLNVAGDDDQTFNSLLYPFGNSDSEKCPISNDESYDKCRKVLLSNIISELSSNGFGSFSEKNTKPLTTCSSSVTNLALCVLEYDSLTLNMNDIVETFEQLLSGFHKLI